MLHLWSLGVEEQFYLVWPLLLFVLLKFPRAILPTLIAIMAGSVAWGEYWLRTGNYSAAYYMLPSRAFQLCAGAFVCSSRKPRQQGEYRRAPCWRLEPLAPFWSPGARTF
ncbi:acyltransferase family protein [Ochrobactrum daejeonense]|nr:acyltransferase family protein [Brucella daejeonensis]